VTRLGKPKEMDTGDRIYWRMAELVDDRHWTENAALCQAIGEEIERRLTELDSSPKLE